MLQYTYVGITPHTMKQPTMEHNTPHHETTHDGKNIRNLATAAFIPVVHL